VINRRISFVAR